MQQQLVQKMLPAILMKAWEKRNAILENEQMALVCIPYKNRLVYAPIGALLRCWEEKYNALNIVLKAHHRLPDCFCKDNRLLLSPYPFVRLHLSVYSFTGNPMTGSCAWSAIDLTTGIVYHGGTHDTPLYAYLSDIPSFGKLTSAVKPWSAYYRNRLSEGITPATFEELYRFLEIDMEKI